MSIHPKDIGKAIRKALDWRQRSARRYEDRLRAEHASPIRRIAPNRKRQARKWEDAYGSQARVRAIQAMPCCVPGCEDRPSQNAHVVSRGAGGTWRDVVPMCFAHHKMQHLMGILRFQREYGVDLSAVAARLAREVEP